MTAERDLRIVFMGTPDFAVKTLEVLLMHHYKVVGVITAPDRPAGRGQKLKASAVKTFALSKGLKILQPTNLKAPEFIEELEGLRANLQIVVAFRMLPEVVWRMPTYGTFNLHASLLPQYRGAAPIHWAIMNGEKETGVTTFFIDEKIDTGAIILSERTAIGPDMTVGELHDRLMELGSQLVLKTVKLIAENNVVTKIQPQSGNLKTAYKLNRANCKIDWTQPLDHIYNKIRGLNPYPSAWCFLQNGDAEELMVKLFKVRKHRQLNNEPAGAITVTQNSIMVACTDGYIEVMEIQLPGKRKMDLKSLLNGYEFQAHSKLL